MFTIYVDTREKKPLKLKHKFLTEQVVTTLNYGDYACSVDNNSIPFVFERKSLKDLFGTMGKGYNRFRKEIERAKADKVTLIIIIECSLTEVVVGCKYSKMSGIGVMRTLFTLMMKYQVPFVCCKDRKDMSLYITEFFYSYAKRMKEGK